MKNTINIHDIHTDIESILEDEGIGQLLEQLNSDWRLLIKQNLNLKNYQFYNVVSGYIDQYINNSVSFYPFNPNHIKMLFLLNHFYDSLKLKNIKHEKEDERINLFLSFLNEFNYIYNKILDNYVDICSFSSNNLIAIEELNDQDINYLKLSQHLISKSTFSTEKFTSIFYLLLFFNLYSELECAHNQSHETKSIRKKAVFCLRILPHIIGAYSFDKYHSKLKDYAFYMLDLELYKQTKKQISFSVMKMKQRELFIDKIKSLSKNIISKSSIQYRLKGVFSTYLKSNTYNIPVSQIWDLFAIRIIIDSSETGDCYQFLSLIESIWDRWENKKGYFDYISNPKVNDYQSIHLVLNISDKLLEVQIRTKSMDTIAEIGSASHLSVYKANKSALKLSSISISDASKGKKLLEKHLHKKQLKIDDFLSHLQSLGNVLDVVPVDHYYEGIQTGKYDAELLVSQISVKVNL